MTCTSVIAESAKAADSTQRGQFLRCRAASRTKWTSSRIRATAIRLSTMIIDSVICAVGVRSRNATDSASSVSDR